MTRAAIRGLGVLVAYAVVVVGLTWPLATRLGTHLPKVHVSSEYDGLFLAWTLAHQTHALVTAPREFVDGNIFHPAPHAVFYGETAFGALPYFVPTFLVTRNAIAALNVMVLVSVTLTACGMHLVVRRWTGSHAAGFVAAATLLLTRWVVPGGLAGAPNFAVLQYFPAIIFLAAAPALGRGRAVLLSLLVVLQGLTSVYMAAAVLIPLAILSVWRVTRRAGGLGLGAVVCVSAALLVPCYAGHLVVARENPALSTQSFFPAFTQEADLPFGPISYWTATGVPAAAFALILVGIFVRRRRRRGIAPRAAWAQGGFWTVIGFLMALGPTAHLAGRQLTLPHTLPARALGLYDLLRVTDRLGVAALMGLSILAGLAFAECAVSRSRRTIAAIGLAALMLVEYLRGPVLPVLGRLRTHTYFATIAGFPAGIRVPSGLFILLGLSPFDYPLVDVGRYVPDPAIRPVLDGPGGPVLELPVGPGAGGSPEIQARAIFRSTLDWRPRVNGYSRCFPAGFPALMQLARRLPDPDALAELRRATGVELVLVHFREMDPTERATWLALVDQHGRPDLRPVAQGPVDVVFQVGAAS